MAKKEMFFRMTNWYPDDRSIHVWYEWIAGRGIPVGMVRWDRKNGALYSVWRGGIDRVGSSEEVWRPEEYHITFDANGFSDLVAIANIKVLEEDERKAKGGR